MRLSQRLAFAVLAGLPLAACNSAPEEVTPPGAVTEGEATALDEAAKMLDAQRLPEGALPDVDPPVEAPAQTETR